MNSELNQIGSDGDAAAKRKEAKSHIDALVEKRATTRFAIILLLVAFALLFAVPGYFLYRNHLDNVGVQTTLTGLARDVANLQLQTLPTSPDADVRDLKTTVGTLNSRLTTVESLSEAIHATSTGAFEQMNFLFGTIAAMVTVFGLYSVFRQSIAESTRDRQEEEMRGLVASFRENMKSVNDLINTLRESFEHRAKVETQLGQIDRRLASADEFRNNIERAKEARIAEVNDQAYGLVRELTRDNFKSEINRNHLHEFNYALTALLASADVVGRLRPEVFFARALHYFNQCQYTLAETDMDTAGQLLEGAQTEERAAWYKDHEQEDVKTVLKRISVDRHYHVGIMCYNMARFREARENFEAAGSLDPWDVRSRGYLPELRYFEGRSPFDEVIASFDETQTAFEKLERESEKARVLVQPNRAMLLMRWGNCYFPKKDLRELRKMLPYAEYERFEQAQDRFAAAAKLATLEGGFMPLSTTLIAFSQAQAAFGLGHSLRVGEPRHNRLQDVVSALQDHLAQKTEPVLLYQFNQMLAACSYMGAVTGANSAFYLDRAREWLQRVPRGICTFSPHSKMLLNREEAVQEIDLLRKRFTQ